MESPWLSQQFKKMKEEEVPLEQILQSYQTHNIYSRDNLQATMKNVGTQFQQSKYSGEASNMLKVNRPGAENSATSTQSKPMSRLQIEKEAKLRSSHLAQELIEIEISLKNQNVAKHQPIAAKKISKKARKRSTSKDAKGQEQDPKTKTLNLSQGTIKEYLDSRAGGSNEGQPNLPNISNKNEIQSQYSFMSSMHNHNKFKWSVYFDRKSQKTKPDFHTGIESKQLEVSGAGGSSQRSNEEAPYGNTKRASKKLREKTVNSHRAKPRSSTKIMHDRDSSYDAASSRVHRAP